MLTYDRDSDTYQALTRRYARERTFHVVVPDWEPIPAWATNDDAIARAFDARADIDAGNVSAS